MKLETTAFSHEGAIPVRYTCDGEDLSPALSWSGVPAGTRSFVLICDDPDAPGGTFVHWLYYDIPAEVTGLPEGVPPDDRPPQGGAHGVNGFQRLGYGGPCPPGGEHRYFFRLYALATELELEPGAQRRRVDSEMRGHILAQAELVGSYSRR